MSLAERLNKTEAVRGAGFETSVRETSVEAPSPAVDPKKEQQNVIAERVRRSVIDKLHDKNAEPSEADVQSAIEEILLEYADVINRTERAKLAYTLFNEVMGLGPLEQLLRDPTITEVMVNGPRQVFVERSGKLTLSEIIFRDDEHVMQIVEKIVNAMGRHVDEASPMVDARLKDGSRVNIIIPPLSLVGPVITIRKFSKKPFTINDLIGFGSLTPRMASFLEACVKGNLNMMVSGGTGSGKTTLLNVLSSFVPDGQRIVTIEDAAELQLNQSHVVTLESRPANMEGRGEISIRDLVKNALRMRPDRIIVGEVRGSEALDMLQAMNTGHDGSLSTAHANSPRDVIARLETMVMMTGAEMPMMAIRAQITSALDIIVQQSRLRDGSRRITSVSEITGMEGETVSMQEIFVYETDGSRDAQGRFIGKFRPTGIRPRCIQKIRSNGVAVNDEWFE
ncbi:MAG TPA: CpaF family protein [Clostridia bacterium]|nr:CpaF family protein [Clostridia bacterium]